MRSLLKRRTMDEKTYILPPADAVINTKQPGLPLSEQEFVRRCGCHEADLGSYMMTVMHSRKLKKKSFCELAAIATVGDVMDLQGENRILVKEGLKRLPYTEKQRPYRH